MRYASVWLVAPATPSAPGWAAYALLLLGQALPALAQPLFTNVPAKLAGDWFPESQRDAATVVGALFNPLGNAAGQVIPSLLVSCLIRQTGAGSGSSNDGDDAALGWAAKEALGNGTTAAPPPSATHCPANDIHGMDMLLLVQALLASASALWAVLCFQGEPPSPPSQSAAQRAAALLVDRREGVGAGKIIARNSAALLRDGEFRKLLLGFGLGLAVFNSLLTLIGQLLSPLYHGEDGGTGTAGSAALNQATSDAGVYGGVLIGTGLVGAAIVGPVLDRTHAYRPCLKGLFLVAVGALIFMLLQLRPDNRLPLGIGFGVMGFVMMPLLPTALETAVEVSYPVPEEYSASLLMLVGNVGGLGCTYLLQYLIALEPVYIPPAHRHTPGGALLGGLLSLFSPAGWFLLGTVGLSSIVIFTYNGQYRRLHAEEFDTTATAATSSSSSRTTAAGSFVGGNEGLHASLNR